MTPFSDGYPQRQLADSFTRFFPASVRPQPNAMKKSPHNCVSNMTENTVLGELESWRSQPGPCLAQNMRTCELSLNVALTRNACTENRVERATT